REGVLLARRVVAVAGGDLLGDRLDLLGRLLLGGRGGTLLTEVHQGWVGQHSERGRQQARRQRDRERPPGQLRGDDRRRIRGGGQPHGVGALEVDQQTAGGGELERGRQPVPPAEGGLRPAGHGRQ